MAETDAPPPITDAAEDLRVRRTRSQLADALVALTLVRPYEAITIRELTEHAGIGYATFFRHYKSKEELLRAILHDVLTDLLGLMRPLARAEPHLAGAQLFRHAERHADLYRLLLRTGRTGDLLRQAVRVGVDSVLETYEARPDSRVPLEIAADHFVASLLRLLESWLEQDRPYPPERMGEIYRDLILRPLEESALQPKDER